MTKKRVCAGVLFFATVLVTGSMADPKQAKDLLLAALPLAAAALTLFAAKNKEGTALGMLLAALLSLWGSAANIVQTVRSGDGLSVSYWLLMLLRIASPVMLVLTAFWAPSEESEAGVSRARQIWWIAGAAQAVFSAAVSFSVLYVYAPLLAEPEGLAYLTVLIPFLFSAAAKTAAVFLTGEALAEGTVKREKPVRTDGSISMTKHILLLMLTCGVWPLIWIYRTTAYLNRDTQRPRRDPLNQMLLCWFVPLYRVWWCGTSARRAERLIDGEPITLICALLALLPLPLPEIILQSRINAARTAHMRPQTSREPKPNADGNWIWQSDLANAPKTQRWQQPADAWLNGVVTEPSNEIAEPAPVPAGAAEPEAPVVPAEPVIPDLPVIPAVADGPAMPEAPVIPTVPVVADLEPVPAAAGAAEPEAPVVPAEPVISAKIDGGYVMTGADLPEAYRVEPDAPVVPAEPVVQDAPLGIADELRKYQQLLADGVITQAEFDALKKRLIGI